MRVLLAALCIFSGYSLYTMNTEITQSKDVLGGTLVFKETRVPVKALIDYLEGGDSIATFLEDFPSVSRRQVLAVIEEARTKLHLAGEAA